MISINRGIAAACLLVGIFAGHARAATGAAAGTGEAASKRAAGEENRILVIVNHDSIKTQDLNNLIIAAHNKMSNTTRAGFDYEKLLKKTVNDRLIIQEARAMQLDKDESVVKTLETIRENAALSQFLKKNYKPHVDVSKKEIADAFNHYYRKLQIRTLAVPTKADAEKRIEEIKKGVSMDSLARRYSLDTHKYDGGLHPLLHFADIEVQLRDMAVKMKAGEITPPFAYHDVFAVFRLEQSLPADPKELPSLENNILMMLMDEKKQAAWDKFLVGLKAKNPPVINNANLTKIANDSARVLTENFLKGDSTPIIQIKSGEKVTDQEFRTRLSRYVMTDGNMGFPKLVDKTLGSLTAELTLNAAVKAKGYLRIPAVNAVVKRSLDSCLIELYVQEMVAKNIKFNKKEFDDYYQLHIDDFRDPDQFKFSKLLVSTKDSADALVARLNKGADFKYLAAQIANGKAPDNRGADWVSLMVFPDKVQAQLKGLAIGHHSDAFKTSEGWVVFNVDDRRKGRIKTMEEVDLKIRQVIFQKKFNQGMDTVLATLKKNTNIVYFQANIRDYFGKSD